MIKKGLMLLSMALLFFDVSYGQTKSGRVFNNDELMKTVKKFRSEGNLCKAYRFYSLKQWDSAIVYCKRQSASKSPVIYNYTHFIEGVSLRQKKLLTEARKALLPIPNTFKFYPLVVSNLGEIALEEGHFQEALQFFAIVEERAPMGYCLKLSSLYHNIGLCHFHLKQFDAARQYLFKALQIQEKAHDTLLLAGSYMDIGNLYYEQYKDIEAVPYFVKAYQFSKKVKNFEVKQNAAMNMAVVEENRKNLSSALAYRKEFETWKDSLNDQNKVWAIAETEKKYIVNQKQKEIMLLEAKNKVRETQRNGLFYSSILLLSLFGTGAYFYRQKIKSGKVIIFQKLALDELNATKDRLFSIVSHDLRSSVHALKSSNNKLQQSLESKDYGALNAQLHSNSKIANGTYNLLDNLLHWAMLQTRQAYFVQEQQHLFSVVQQVAYNYKAILDDKGMSFENGVSEAIFVWADLDSIKIILRNLIDNAIKFSGANGNLRIYTAASDGAYCNLVIEDSGTGMDDKAIKMLLDDKALLLSSNDGNGVEGTGLGMQLCKSLILKNGGLLAIDSHKGSGTKIIITLPKTQSDA